MGYLVHYSFHDVRIPATQSAAALAAIHALYHPDTIAHLGTALRYDRATNTMQKYYCGGQLPSTGQFASLIEALQAWSLGTVQHPDGSVEIVEYCCDKAGDEGVLFEAIAPFLDYRYRARIDAFQDNNEHWRHVFLNGQHRQVAGKVVYPDDPETED